MQHEVWKFVTFSKGGLVELSREMLPLWSGSEAAADPAIFRAGRFAAKLKPQIRACGRILGGLWTGGMIEPASNGDAFETCVMAAEGRPDGEVKHAPNPIQTIRIGSVIRMATVPKPCSTSIRTRGFAKVAASVSSIYEKDVGRRSHDLSVRFSTPAVPRADRSVVVPGTAVSDRPNTALKTDMRI